MRGIRCGSITGRRDKLPLLVQRMLESNLDVEELVEQRLGAAIMCKSDSRPNNSHTRTISVDLGT